MDRQISESLDIGHATPKDIMVASLISLILEADNLSTFAHPLILD